MPSLDLQFLLREPADEQIVLSAIGEIVGFAVDSVDYPDPLATGVVLVGEHEQGFKRSYLLVHPDANRIDPLEFAKRLAMKLGVPVLVEAPASHDWFYIDADTGQGEVVTLVELDGGVDVKLG